MNRRAHQARQHTRQAAREARTWAIDVLVTFAAWVLLSWLAAWLHGWASGGGG